MICLLSALEAEARVFLDALDNPAVVAEKPCRWWSGTLEGLPAVVGVTGVGKVMAAAACQATVDRFSPRAVLFTGAAGALSDDLKVGDVVVARDCVQYDLDLRRFGFAVGEIPRTGLRFFPADGGMAAVAETCNPRGYRVVTGRIATGDLFLSPEGLTHHQAALTQLGASAVDMEGAAAACVAAMNGVPFLLIRYITDLVRDGNPRGFKKKVKTGSQRSLDLVRRILNSFADGADAGHTDVDHP